MVDIRSPEDACAIVRQPAATRDDRPDGSGDPWIFRQIEQYVGEHWRPRRPAGTSAKNYTTEAHLGDPLPDDRTYFQMLLEEELPRKRKSR